MTNEDPLLACLRGRITPATAIAHLLLGGEDPAGIYRRVQAAYEPGSTWTELDRLTRQGPDLQRLRAMIDAAGVDHHAPATPVSIAARFDRAVAISPEASVALYSLGDTETLRMATDEIILWLRDQRLLASHIEALDLGCGIGRVACAMAPHVRSVLGIDISAAMVEEARQRCAKRTNVWLSVTTGQDLGMLADGAFDLVLAVDSFPYLLQAGVAERHVAESYRVLRPGGVLVILNLSYRGDLQTDCTDARAWAYRYRFLLSQTGVSPFRLWDATAFVFARI
jgi:ubiquinone/menaquinone biosynthesis C-methylase UbiE